MDTHTDISRICCALAQHAVAIKLPATSGAINGSTICNGTKQSSPATPPHWVSPFSLPPMPLIVRSAVAIGWHCQRDLLTTLGTDTHTHLDWIYSRKIVCLYPPALRVQISCLLLNLAIISNQMLAKNFGWQNIPNKTKQFYEVLRQWAGTLRNTIRIY